MRDSITYTEDVIFAPGHEGVATGRNGTMRVRGLRAWRSLDRSMVTLEPRTSRGLIGNCRIVIPTAELPRVIAMLTGMLDAAVPATAAPIVVTVEGGAVQDVTGIPRGMTVQIHDYDVDGADCDEGDLDRDANGSLFATDTYEGRED